MEMITVGPGKTPILAHISVFFGSVLGSFRPALARALYALARHEFLQIITSLPKERSEEAEANVARSLAAFTKILDQLLAGADEVDKELILGLRSLYATYARWYAPHELGSVVSFLHDIVMEEKLVRTVEHAHATIVVSEILLNQGDQKGARAILIQGAKQCLFPLESNFRERLDSLCTALHIPWSSVGMLIGTHEEIAYLP